MYMANLIKNYTKYGIHSSAQTPSTGLAAAGNRLEKTKNLLKDLRGIDNVYTQHEPVVKKYLSDTISQKYVSDLEYSKAFQFKSSDSIIVYFLGGLTYEESKVAYKLNKQQGAKILIGGCFLWTTETFLNFVEQSNKGA